MRNPEHTRNLILESASILFNTQGYKATSISDITNHAGITKGAIYKHFRDKADLEKACLVSMSGIVLNSIVMNIKKSTDVESKLMSILDYFEDYANKPPFQGGCPIMNAAVEVDDTDEVLKNVVATIMTGIQNGIAQVIQNGVDRGQFDKAVNVQNYSNLIYSALEGGIMMMKVTDNKKHLQGVIQYLKQDIRSKIS